MHSPIKLGINDPCNEQWENMTPVNGGNYCSSCKKTVVDFTGMSDKEVYQFMQQAGTSVCGRFNDGQLNKVFQPAVSQPNVRYRKSIWQLLVAGTLFAAEVKSQERLTTTTVSYPTPDQDSIQLEDDMYLLVDSATGEPLPYASIIADGKDLTTNEKGVFRINTSYRKITIFYVGYQTRDFLLKDNMLPKKIELQPDIQLLDPVSITGGPDKTCNVRLGGVSYGRVITRYQNVVRNLKQWIPDSTVRAFPNPINKGELLNVQLSLKTPGRYAIKVFASDGKQVHVQHIQITSSKQTIQLPLSHAYAAGTYWLYIQDASGRQKGHEVKFIIR